MRKLFIYIILLITSQVAAQDFKLDLDNPNLIFKSEEGKVLAKKEAEDIIYKGAFKLTQKQLSNGKIELTIIPVKGDVNDDTNKKHTTWLKHTLNKPFPEFSFTTLNGKTYNENDLKGKVTVLNFWFIHCSPCIREMPELNKVVKKFDNNSNVQFLAPSLDSEETLNEFFKKTSTKFTYQVVPDVNDFVKGFKVKGYPTHLIIDKKGIIREAIIGYRDNIYDVLSQKINSLL
ncbi:TlpA disulfide reductase family protein [uncultured Psychroserpens sp.]|uniref:TlpA family protein disulfide reductase n=1 Tax=uncultured Psychroserpens sp. TaxID=255436 RepID=UPI00262FB07A|nr:TlpA disulfide reductase family protein [uncultured Psychroserpens sp.]